MKAVFLFLVEVEGGSAMEKQQVEDFICGKNFLNKLKIYNF